MKKSLYLIILLACPFANASVEAIKNKLDNLISQASNNPTLANKIYETLENEVKSLWIGDFPEKETYLKQAKNQHERRTQFLKLLQDSRNRIVSFLSSLGMPEDEKSIMDALNKIG